VAAVDGIGETALVVAELCAVLILLLDDGTSVYGSSVAKAAARERPHAGSGGTSSRSTERAAGGEPMTIVGAIRVA
jgi:hypothetical protein